MMQSPDFEKEGRLALQIFIGLAAVAIVFLCIASFLLGQFLSKG